MLLSFDSWNVFFQNSKYKIKLLKIKGSNSKHVFEIMNVRESIVARFVWHFDRFIIGTTALTARRTLYNGFFSDLLDNFYATSNN